MEGPPLNEFSSLVAPDLFDRYPDFEPCARSKDGSLVVDAPMPSGHGRIVVTALDMPTVRVEIWGCAETLKEFDDPDETFAYLDELRAGTRVPMDQFQEYDAGGVAVLTYRYDADHDPVFGFNFQFTTKSDAIPEEVALELAEKELLPQSLVLDYFFHKTQCVGFVVHEDVATSVTEENVLDIRHFLNTDVRVVWVNAEPLVDDRSLVDADLRHLSSEDASVRLAALSGIVGHARLHRQREHFAKLPTLILPSLDSPDPTMREEVVKVSAALASAGPESQRQMARDLFARAIRDTEASVRTQVARNIPPLLYPIGGDPMTVEEQATFLDEIAPLTEDGTVEVRENAIANLGLFDTPKATAKMLDLTNSDATRVGSILGLQRRLLGAGEVIPRLLAIAENDSLPVLDRAHAMDTLGHYASNMDDVDPRIEPAIMANLSHAEPIVNLGALRALLNFVPSEVPEARILELTRSEFDDVRAQSYMVMSARRIESDAAFAAVSVGIQEINHDVRKCAEHVWRELFSDRKPLEEVEDEE